MKLILFAVPSLVSDEEITEALISVSQKLGNSLSVKIIEQNELLPRSDSKKFEEILRNLTLEIISELCKKANAEM